MYRPGVPGPALDEEGRAGALARVYLERYGVLMRECLEREDAEAEWSQLYPALQRMEMRGEARRGYFVLGLSGLQFALPEAVERLRASAEGFDDAVIVVNATDPLNVYGGELVAGQAAADGHGGSNPSLRFARLPSTHVVLWQGAPALIAEDGGERFTAVGGVEQVVLRRALQAYLTRPHAPRHMLVTQWNGRPVSGTEGSELLRDLGFYRVPAGMEWWSQI